VLYSSVGHGLYGGKFDVHGTYDSSAPLTLTLHGCRFVEDLAVSGSVVWNRTSKVVDATVKVHGPGTSGGSFAVSWDTGIYNWGVPATVTGVFDGQRVDAELPAAWVPQS
jgi:hypothetical protein